MKSKLLFVFLFFTQNIFAQTFTEIASSPPMEGVLLSAIAFADIDGDNDQDILLTGKNNLQLNTTKLYTNDGTGEFTEVMNAPFDGFFGGSVAFGDVDGDNDLDVFITGLSTMGGVSKLYLNDGLGHFSEKMGAPFEVLDYSSVAFADIDGDNDLDLLSTGRNSSWEASTKLYSNDGTGHFTERMDAPLEDVWGSSIAFADVDGDKDEDVILSGKNQEEEEVTKLYTNDGAGNFSEINNLPFAGTLNGYLAFADVDGDDDQDLLITGSGISKLYTNDGAGHFTERTGTPFQGVQRSGIAFADVDEDDDLDVLITGSGTAKLYLNDGAGDFTELMDTPFKSLSLGSVALADVDGDMDQDVLLTGAGAGNVPMTKLYRNDGLVSSQNPFSLEWKAELIPYPNPIASGALNINYNSAEKGLVLLKVYDLKGRLVSEQKELVLMGRQILSIDVSLLASGNYWVELENGKHRYAAKFMVD